MSLCFFAPITVEAFFNPTKKKIKLKKQQIQT